MALSRSKESIKNTTKGILILGIMMMVLVKSKLNVFLKSPNKILEKITVKKFIENQRKAGRARGEQLKEMFSNMTFEERRNYVMPAVNKCKKYWKIFRDFDEENELWIEARDYCLKSMNWFTKYPEFQELIYKNEVKDNAKDELIKKLDSGYFIPGVNCPGSVKYDKENNEWIINFPSFKYFKSRKKFRLPNGKYGGYNKYLSYKMMEHKCKYSLETTEELSVDHIIYSVW